MFKVFKSLKTPLVSPVTHQLIQFKLWVTASASVFEKLVISVIFCTCSVSGIAMAIWTEFLVAGSGRQRAELTLLPPATASVTTTLRPADRNTTAGGHLTHGVQNFSETEAFPVI